MSVLAILQARSGSRRLPRKVMQEILGRPMIERQIERVRRAACVDDLIVATTDDPSDDALADLCAGLGVGCHRGEVDDVLSRFVGAARGRGEEWLVRLTGDCPLADPAIIDAVVREALAADADYVSNVLVPTFPDGLDVEVIRRSVLERADREALLGSEREHVTPYIYKHPELFRIAELRSPQDLSAHRWTVDEPQDLAFVRAVYARLYDADPAFSMGDVLALLAREPSLALVNADISRNEGYIKSMEADRA
jgi:spore coat polysaccharide biosynthesis protein SpsF